MTGPEPPAGPPSAAVRPFVRVLPAGSRLWRIHPAAHFPPTGRIVDDGTLFNPGLGKATRFAPMHDAAGNAVPTMYLGASRRAALFETFLHNQMPNSTIDSAQWREHLLTAITTTVDLPVVVLHGRGLRSLSLHAADLTHTYPGEYPRATRWAEWLHSNSGAAGLTWTSHQDDDEHAYVLWEDRMSAGSLVPDPSIASLPIGFGPGLDWAESMAAYVRVKVI